MKSSQLKNKKVPQIPLRLLLTLPLVLQVSGVVAIVGGLSYRHGQRAVANTAYALMDQVGQRVSQDLEHYLEEAQRFNQNQITAIASQAISPQDLDHLHRHLILQHRQTENLTTLLFGTPQGHFRISHRVSPTDYGVNTELQPEEMPFEIAISEAANPSINILYSVDEAGQRGRYLQTIQGIDVRDRPWYRQAVATGEPGWIGPYQLGATDLLTLNAHSPVYDDDGSLLGVFAANISLNQLGNVLADVEVSQSGEIIILERNGWVVATSTEDGPYEITTPENTPSQLAPQTLTPGQVTFERLRPTALTNPTLQQGYRYLSQAFPNFALASLQSPLAIHTTVSGPRYFITVTPYSHGDGLDWLVITVIPETDFTAEMQRNLRNTLVLCVLALGGAIASGMVISKRVTRHITQLTTASVALAGGDLTQQVPANSSVTETRALALAFNQMAEKLRQSFQNQVAAAAARQSEAHFQRLASAVPGVIYTYTLHADGTSQFDYASSVTQNILELTPEQVEADAEAVLAQIHPDDRPAYEAALTRSIATLKPFSLVFRSITPSGQLKWLEANSQPLPRGDGSITWYGLLLDVSPRAQSEAALQINAQKLADSEARFQKMAATLPGMLYSSILSPDGETRFIYGSPTISEILEVEAEDAIADANVIFNLYHPDDRAGFMAAREQSVALMQPLQYEWRVITPSGKTKWLQVNSRYERLPNQDILSFGVVIDISARKWAELELQRQKDLRETIYNEASDALFLIDPDTLLITDCNQRTVELFEVKNKAVLIGTEGHALQGKSFSDEDLARIVVELEHNGFWSREIEYVTAKGKQFWGNLAAKVVRISDQKIYLVRVTDISDRIDAQAALQEANQQLEVRLQDLSQRNQDMVLLGNMNDFLQACLTPKEAYRILPDLLQLMFPDCAGGIFTITAPDGKAKAQATWGQPLLSKTEFRLDHCWALRRGRGHWVSADRPEQHCQHILPDPNATTFCIPMLAQGEILGLLYLCTTQSGALPPAKQQLGHTVAEQVALALVNLYLRATLEEQSLRDPLTGLYNRRHLEQSLQNAIDHAQRDQHPVGVVMMDADHFKLFNDTYGHDLGDRVLQSIAQVLKAGMGSSDLACRYGGEEFTLILPQSSPSETVARADALRQQVNQLTLGHNGQPIKSITASCGVACFPQHGLTGAELLRKADQALYTAKNTGRNKVICASLESGTEP